MTSLAYGDHEGTAGKNTVVSTIDVEKLLEYQVERMQSKCSISFRPAEIYINPRSGLGGRLPHEIKSHLRAMIETGVTVPSLSHYVQHVQPLSSE